MELTTVRTFKCTPRDHEDIYDFYDGFCTGEKIQFDYVGGEEICRQYLDCVGLQDYFVSVVLVGLPPGKSLPIHIDSGDRIFTFLYGLRGREHLEWITYDVGENASVPHSLNEENPHNVYHMFTEEDIVSVLAKEKFNKKFVANIKVPHTVKNCSNEEPAFCISMRLSKDFSISTIEEVTYVP